MSGIAVNGDLINRTVVNETDTISFNCTARGRPTAGIVLKKNYKVIGQRDVGDVTRDDVAVLVHTTQQAQCEDAGLYTCSANNKIGDADEYDVKVFVNCEFTFTGIMLIFKQAIGTSRYPPIVLTEY